MLVDKEVGVGAEEAKENTLGRALAGCRGEKKVLLQMEVGPRGACVQNGRDKKGFVSRRVRRQMALGGTERSQGKRAHSQTYDSLAHAHLVSEPGFQARTATTE